LLVDLTYDVTDLAIGCGGRDRLRNVTNITIAEIHLLLSVNEVRIIDKAKRKRRLVSEYVSQVDLIDMYNE
jgi:hypothetical protein